MTFCDPCPPSSLPRALFARPERDERFDTGTPTLRPRQRPYRLSRAAGEADARSAAGEGPRARNAVPVPKASPRSDQVASTCSVDAGARARALAVHARRDPRPASASGFRPRGHESPVTQSIRAGVAQLGEPLERHADGSAIFEMDDEIAFEDLYAEGPRTFRCRNTHATSPGNRCDAESPII